MGCEQGNYIADRLTEPRVSSDHVLTTENNVPQESRVQGPGDAESILSELPPVRWTEAEDAEWLRTYNDGRSAPSVGGRKFYSSFSEALNNFHALVCRERQLREALAQLRAADAAKPI